MTQRERCARTSHGWHGDGHAFSMATPAASRPPILDAELRRWVLADSTELRVLRALLSDAVGMPVAAGHARDEVVKKILIVVTELATNALKYGLPPTVVRLCRSGQDYVIDVVDHNPATLPEQAQQQRPGFGGLGLVLARALALDVGWYITTTKHVWAPFSASTDDET